MIRLTRRYRFSASHRLHARGLSEAENRELYGKCNNPYGHGHDYLLEVGVRGPVEERSGRVAEVAALDRLVGGEVIRAFDHRDLNQDVPEFASVVPTTENLALEVERRLRRNWSAAFPGEWPRLDRIRIRETKRNIFEIS
jgi:6-pyruvoyltetrahydropterin/6-carboxytetrahydropterin synthase